jgi:hypothetical protein
MPRVSRLRGSRMSRSRVMRMSRRPGQIISHPPQIRSYGITRDVRLRFSASAAFAGSITYQNLLDTILMVTSATTAFDLFDQVRVNSVEVWSIAALGTPATATVIFDGASAGSAGDQKTHTDTSMGVEPAHVKASPDPLTQAGQFQFSQTANAFELLIPTGSIVDVSMSLRQPVNGGAVAAQNAVVAGTPGTVCYRGLDGKAFATTVLIVVGVEGAAIV